VSTEEFSFKITLKPLNWRVQSREVSLFLEKIAMGVQIWSPNPQPDFHGACIQTEGNESLPFHIVIPHWRQVEGKHMTHALLYVNRLSPCFLVQTNATRFIDTHQDWCSENNQLFGSNTVNAYFVTCVRTFKPILCSKKTFLSIIYTLTDFCKKQGMSPKQSQILVSCV